MQLLKITTTPIKYRIESERASIELAEPDSTKSFQQVQKTVIQQHGKTQLSSGQDLDSNSDVISADSSGKIRTDSMIKSSSEKMGSDDYLIKYRYGQNKSPNNLILIFRMIFLFTKISVFRKNWIRLNL